MKEKNLSKKNQTSNIQPLTTSRGITLIALVITIIVMLILVSVTIGIAVNGGLFDYAGKAVGETKNAINSEQQFIDQIVLGDYEGNYNQEKHVNKPKLAEGMIPIKYNGSNWEICSEDDKEWYDYSEDKMEWANVMLLDGKYKTAEVGTKVSDADLGSMFVWIPRYAYSINEYGTPKSGEGTTQKITNVTFLVGTTNKDITGKEYAFDYNTNEVEKAKEDAEKEGKTVSTPAIVHPAFNFGGKSLTGLWVAKFEASMEGQTNTNIADTTTGDDITTKDVKVLPNVQSWRYIRVGNMFANCLKMNKSGNIYGINNTVDSHLMKNSEWGAVAYLSASQYGITPTINTSGKSVDGKDEAYTGGSEILGNYKNNVTQSTTGNVTGIYDMCGGAWEYVAAYYDNRNGNIGAYGTSAYFEGNKLKAEYEKYWDRYEVDEGEINPDASWQNNNETIRSLAEKRLNLMKDVKGVGMYEVKNTFSFFGKLATTDKPWNWMTDVSDTSTKYGVGIYNNDYTAVGNISRPFLFHGGAWYSSSYAGIFASSGDGGYAYSLGRLPPGACCILIWNFLGRTF